MARVLITALRVLQLALSLASIGLSSYVVNYLMMGSRTSSTSSFSFLIAASSLSILSLVYLEAASKFAPRYYHPYAAMAIEATNTIFYFAGFIAIGIFIGSLTLCTGSVCSAGRADTVVAAGQFTAWIATTFFMAQELFRRVTTESKDIIGDREMTQA